jgi:hypothetical protein
MEQSNERGRGYIGAALFFAAVAFFGVAGSPAEGAFLGDTEYSGRGGAVHVIPLRDEEDRRISGDDDPQLPFSPRQTCGGCHDYETAAGGWHFNAANRSASRQAAGRPGQPWFYTDPAIAVQIPVSYRRWPGTFGPEELGLSRWDFAKRFGGMTAGGIEEPKDLSAADPESRWLVSGSLEANCLACHHADPAHDQSSYAAQIARENFRWAAAATCGFASAKGSAKDMPEMYDYMMPAFLDDPKLIPPSITYSDGEFDSSGNIFMDVRKQPQSRRCYFCHSTVAVGEDRPLAPQDEDVHLEAGLTCADCHRNGIDHQITRGYEGEDKESDNPLAATSSCSGCHLGAGSSKSTTAGRLGAPNPRHAGIPPVHFRKLSCTACHSGPWPDGQTGLIQTSRSHGLGLHGVSHSETALPHIASPVFATGGDGKIAPHNAVWPAFWARLDGNSVRPLVAEAVEPIIKSLLAGPDRRGGWPVLEPETLVKAVKLLDAEHGGEGSVGYIGGGRLWSVDGEKLVVRRHAAAEPCMWPLAHNVRPAAQSLGIRSCQDCHKTNSPFIFGRVAVDGPLEDGSRYRTMVTFQQAGELYSRLFAMSFVFRPYLKLTCAAAAACLSAMLLLYGLKALDCIARAVAGRRRPAAEESAAQWPPILSARKLFYALSAALGLLLAVTGFYPLLAGGAISGYSLMLHVTCGGAFAVCLAAIAVLSAHRHRFEGADLMPQAAGSRRQTGRPGLAGKIAFWVVVAASVPLVLSVLLSMLGLFGTAGQELLLSVHIYSAAVVVAAAFVHLLFMLAKRRGRF